MFKLEVTIVSFALNKNYCRDIFFSGKIKAIVSHNWVGINGLKLTTEVNINFYDKTADY